MVVDTERNHLHQYLWGEVVARGVGCIGFSRLLPTLVNQQQLLISASADMLWLKRGGVPANDRRHNIFPSLVVETGSSGLAL